MAQLELEYNLSASLLNSTNLSTKSMNNMPIISDDSTTVGENCPVCSGADTHFEVTLRYWKCESCLSVWGVGLNKSYFNPVHYHETTDEKKQENE